MWRLSACVRGGGDVHTNYCHVWIAKWLVTHTQVIKAAPLRNIQQARRWVFLSVTYRWEGVCAPHVSGRAACRWAVRGDAPPSEDPSLSALSVGGRKANAVDSPGRHHLHLRPLADLLTWTHEEKRWKTLWGTTWKTVQQKKVLLSFLHPVWVSVFGRTHMIF